MIFNCCYKCSRCLFLHLSMIMKKSLIMSFPTLAIVLFLFKAMNPLILVNPAKRKRDGNIAVRNAPSQTKVPQSQRRVFA